MDSMRYGADDSLNLLTLLLWMISVKYKLTGCVAP